MCTENENIGLAEALGREICLRLNSHHIYPTLKLVGHAQIRCELRTISKVVNHKIVIAESGEAHIRLITPSVCSDGVIVACSAAIEVTLYDQQDINSFYNPEIVLRRIVKAATFVEGIGEFMLNCDLQWLADGVRQVIERSVHLEIHDAVLAGARSQNVPLPWYAPMGLKQLPPLMTQDTGMFARSRNTSYTADDTIMWHGNCDT
jgi:hypothetical protein